MQRILVATDFSPRSDRAIRRACILAKQFNSTLRLVHVIDDDRPQSLVATERREAETLLAGIVKTLRELDGLSADAKVILGTPFAGLLQAAGDTRPDLMVLGLHRRRILKDVFVGTTGERIIRSGRWPVLVANAAPAQKYRRILIATDFSECSAQAVRTSASLGFLKAAAVIAMHAYEAPNQSLMYKASMTMEETKDYLLQERRRAENDLIKFLRDTNVDTESRLLKLVESSPAAAIRDCAGERHADLIVMGARGQNATGKAFRGDIINGVLRYSDKDILAVPCSCTGH